MRRFLALAILLSAAACGAPAEDATDSTPQDWIEVPLADHVFRDMPAGYRQDTLDVEVPPGPGLEVKLAMREGDALVYTWVAEGLDDPSQLLSEFHGHTEREHPTEGPITTFASPLDFEKTKVEFRRHAPRIGGDGEEVLREAGVNDAEIAKLKADNALLVPGPMAQ
jgi:hypothetical protein